MKHIAGWLFIVLLATAPSIAMSRVSIISFPGYKNSLLVITVDDNISKDDAFILSNAAADMERKHGANWRILAKLNSKGGSVSAALKIGRILRQVGAMATVGPDAICMSSCVYVLAGAENRAVEGRVGIHRPYEPEGTEESPSVQKNRYFKLGTEIKTFFAEVNIPAKLYEDMLYVSPESMKVLTTPELQAYGLNKNDPFTEEADAVKEAKALGLTRMELAERKANANRLCPWNGNRSKEAILRLLECREAVVKGR